MVTLGMASCSATEVRALDRRHHRPVAEMLGRAFVNDPLIGAIVPKASQPAERAWRMSRLFTMMLAQHYGIRQPLLGIIANDIPAAAAIVELADCSSSRLQEMWHGLGEWPLTARALGVEGLKRRRAMHEMLKRNRPAAPHIYLNVLGVEPDFQGHGFGSAILDLLRSRAQKCPKCVGVYLETAVESNVTYYERFGYRVIGEIYPLKVRTWRMLQPR
jgi:ribosomal protein S18 acetylase RimI-like enzyme